MEVTVPKTMLIADAALRRLQAEFLMDRPTIWKFINGIRALKKRRDCLHEQFVGGGQAPVTRRKYVATDARIRRIVESYSERNIIEYLKGLSHNFLMEPRKSG